MKPIHVVIACLGCTAVGFLGGVLLRADIRVNVDTEDSPPAVVERSR